MGNWFENMEKMDIQAERRNTQEAKEQLAKAEEALSNTKSQFISYIINSQKKQSCSKESAVAEIMTQCGKTETEAKELVEKYW